MPSAENETLGAASPFSPEAGDVDAFLAYAEFLFAGICTLYRPVQLHAIKIDNWFGPRWLRFSGKMFGIVGVQQHRLTFPPFVPNRVVFEQTYERVGEAELYRVAKAQRVFHIAQKSPQNLNRYVNDLAPTTAILWFSGASAENGQDAIMAHVPAEGFHWSWYVGLAAENGWGLATHRGISPVELRYLRRAGEAGRDRWRS